MENKLLSLYDYLGKAAGMELGDAVCKAAIKSEEPIGEREISNPKYVRMVHLYRKEFLDKYFNVDQTKDLPF